MRDSGNRISRRGFLSGLAVLGLTPIASRVAEAFPSSDAPKRWTGDNFDEAHQIMRNPYGLLRDPASWIKHDALHEVIIVGGGIANTFLAATGVGVGKSLHEAEMLDVARRLMTKAKEKPCAGSRSFWRCWEVSFLESRPPLLAAISSWFSVAACGFCA